MAGKKTAKASGMVYLVGAGPGDPGLLTLRAVELLGRADVVLYDHLLHPAILEHAREGAELIDVGKTAGKHVMPQEEIQKLLVRKAKAGQCVVRLKGGDPFIFGRGGEEALELTAAGVRFEIVPGVTSAIAVPAYAGIPVTFRNAASSCTIVTGHEDPAKGRSDVAWDKLAQTGGTLIVLMGTKNLAKITGDLARGGMPKATPCAVVSSGTYPGQQTVTGKLSDIAAKVEKANLPTPTILVVGEVVNLRDKLGWFEKRPLSGKTVLVTRAREQASDLLKTLEGLGARAHQAPVIRIVPPESYAALDAAIKDVANFDWIFFTSVNGVKAFLSRMAACGLEADALRGVKIAVIGPASLGPLEEAGLQADLIPKRFVAEGLIEEIDARNIALEGKRVLSVRAQEVRELLAQELRKRGANVTEAAGYKTISEAGITPEIVQELRDGKVDWITFTSSSTVKNFFGLLDHKVGNGVLKKARMASIGPITSETLRGFGHEPTVEAAVHTIPGLVEAILQGGKS